MFFSWLKFLPSFLYWLCGHLCFSLKCCFFFCVCSGLLWKSQGFSMWILCSSVLSRVWCLPLLSVLFVFLFVMKLAVSVFVNFKVLFNKYNYCLWLCTIKCWLYFISWKIWNANPLCCSVQSWIYSLINYRQLMGILGCWVGFYFLSNLSGLAGEDFMHVDINIGSIFFLIRSRSNDWSWSIYSCRNGC